METIVIVIRNDHAWVRSCRGGCISGVAMTALQLSIKNLSKTFPGTKALDKVDFDLAAGEVHALVGANGSGKSTLVKILAGVYQPDPGATAEVLGRPFELGSVDAAASVGLRFVHQDTGLVHSLDTVDNIALGRSFETRHGRIDWKRQREVAKKALHDLGYDFDIRVPVGELRSSARTGIAIARSLIGWEESASILVLDEPTASLPKPEVEKLFDVVRNVRSLGVSVIYISHHLNEVFAVADRVTVIRDGIKVGTRTVADLGHDELVEMMVGAPVERVAGSRRMVVTAPVLEVRELSTKVLDNVDFTVSKGEILGIAGITGSGRDEVASAIFGGKERRGVVAVSGQTVPPERPDVSVDRGIGLVPSDRHGEGVVLGMSVLENLTVVDLRPYWQRFLYRHRGERSDAQMWIDRLSVKPRRFDPLISTLSGGNQQKVVIGKWLRIEPAVLLLDEPTQGVDIGSKAEIHALIDEAASKGTAVVVCSSDESELERLCDRVIVLYDGRVSDELVGDEIIASRITQLSLGAGMSASAPSNIQTEGARR